MAGFFWLRLFCKKTLQLWVKFIQLRKLLFLVRDLLRGCLLATIWFGIIYFDNYGFAYHNQEFSELCGIFGYLVRLQTFGLSNTTYKVF